MIKFFRHIRQKLLSQNRISKYLFYAIGEIVLVVIGILIALNINNWNEERKDHNYLNKIFASMDAELEESRQDIIEKLPKQQLLVDNLGKYMNDESKTLFDIIQLSQGLNGPNIKNNAWTAIASSRIELIDYEKVSLLSEIDESKRFLEAKGEKIIDFMVSNIKETGSDKKEIFMLLNQDVISSQKYLLKELEEFLSK